MPSARTTSIRALACALLCLTSSAQAASAQTATKDTLRNEVAEVLTRTVVQWSTMLTPTGVFQNPFAADVARGHSSFVPPLLAYAVHRTGERIGDPTLVRAAERAWPQAVDATRASAFDMVGAAYAYRNLEISEARKLQLASYLRTYGIPPNGYSCLIRPECYGNLRLVDALAMLSITGAGVRNDDPAARLGNPVAARKAALQVVNQRIGQVVDHGVRARIGRLRVRGTYLSDPDMNPIAYHALSAFMLSEAVAQLGPEASRSARRARRETMEALSVLVAPDGDVSYLGRGQGQTWVPAIAAGALASGARETARRHPARARRYLVAAQVAVRRLVALHVSPTGLQLVPGAVARSTAEGIDLYAHTVAYNGLALFGLTVALEALDATPDLRIGRLPAERRLGVRDPDTSGLGVVASRGVWLAVHRKAAVNDLRFDFGALALKRRTAQGWIDLLAPRPYAPLVGNTAGPALVHRGRLITPGGHAIRVRGRTITVEGGYRVGDRWIRHARFRWRLTRTGARLAVSGVRRGDRFRFLAFTPAGTGTAARRALVAAGARWRFDRTIRVARLPGYHSGPVEQLDALEAQLTAPKSGRFVVAIGGS